MQQSSKHLQTRSAETSSLGSSRFEENSIKKIEGLQNCLNLQKSGPWKLHRDQAPGVTGVQVSVTVKQNRNCMLSARLNWFQILLIFVWTSGWYHFIMKFCDYLLICLKQACKWQSHRIPQTHILWGRFQDHFPVPAGFSHGFLNRVYPPVI